jgi:hypothetical protein
VLPREPAPRSIPQLITELRVQASEYFSSGREGGVPSPGEGGRGNATPPTHPPEPEALVKWWCPSLVTSPTMLMKPTLLITPLS